MDGVLHNSSVYSTTLEVEKVSATLTGLLALSAPLPLGIGSAKLERSRGLHQGRGGCLQGHSGATVNPAWQPKKQCEAREHARMTG